MSTDTIKYSITPFSPLLEEKLEEEKETILYTPSLLAEQVALPVGTVRALYRHGLLQATKQVGRLLYFASSEIPALQKYSRLIARGLTTETIAKSIEQIRQRHPLVESIADHLTLSTNGLHLLFEEQGLLIDPSGQGYFNFESAADSLNHVSFDDWVDERPFPFAVPVLSENIYLTDAEKKEFDRILGHHIVELCETAWKMEEVGQLSEALELYRTALIAGGPDAGICFQLAELLERKGELQAARERYYIVLELDEEYLEARANLGRVLAKLGQHEEAIAALQGVLEHHSDYREVHLELGHLLFKMKRYAEAEDHLRFYLATSPETPRGTILEEMLDTIAQSRQSDKSPPIQER